MGNQNSTEGSQIMNKVKQCPCGNKFGGTPDSNDCCDSGICVINNKSSCCGLELKELGD